MRYKKITFTILTIAVVILVVLIVKYAFVDIKWSVSPYSGTRDYLCPNTLDDGRASDISIGYYRENFSVIYLYPDSYIPPKHNSRGDLSLASDISGTKTYKGNTSELTIEGTRATLKESGKIVLSECQQVFHDQN